jgi:hypothetical protein
LVFHGRETSLDTCVWWCMVYKVARTCADFCCTLTAFRSQASFILHPCKLPPRTSCYCICNLLVHDPSSHLPGPGSLCLTAGLFCTINDVWISWLTPFRPTFAVAKHPSMLKLHFLPNTLVFDPGSIVSKTVSMVYLIFSVDRMAPCITMLYSDSPCCLEDL